MFLTKVLRSVAVLFSLLQSLNGLCNISVIFIIGDLCHHQSTMMTLCLMMTNIRPLIAISFTRSRAYIQGAFFYRAVQKTTKYKENLKYQNCSANCSSQKILSTRKKQSIRTEITAHVNLLMKSQLTRSITRGVGLLELFPLSFWGEEQFWYFNFFHS